MEYLKNKYSEVEIIRKTNWADIYVAINNETHEKVQLKVLKSQSSNMKYINEIKYAVNELQDLKHENLIGINDMSSFIENNTSYYYIETEYFKGKTLGEKMILGSHTCRESLEIIKQVAQGLNEFHYKGLNYETLSAENILINSQGVVKIDVLSYIQQKYDEDEEYDNYDGFDDGRDKDIYAIGIILYQLITRDSDFKLRKLKKNIEDEEVYSILYSLTSKKIKYRYENLNEFLLDVNEHLEYLSSDDNQDFGYINENKREFEDNFEEYDEEYDDESNKSVLIKRLCACLAVVLIVVGGIKVMALVKKDNSKTETTIEMETDEESTEEDLEEESEEELDDQQVESTDNNISDTDRENTTTNNINNNTTTTQNSSNSTNSGSTSTGGTGTGSSGSGSTSTGGTGTGSSGSGRPSTGGTGTGGSGSGSTSTGGTGTGGSGNGSTSTGGTGTGSSGSGSTSTGGTGTGSSGSGSTSTGGTGTGSSGSGSTSTGGTGTGGSGNGSTSTGGTGTGSSGSGSTSTGGTETGGSGSEGTETEDTGSVESQTSEQAQNME